MDFNSNVKYIMKRQLHPLGNSQNIRLCLVHVAAEVLEPHKNDGKAAFLNGEFEKDISTPQLKGCIDIGPCEVVCKPLKTHHGFKQAPGLRLGKISAFLLAFLIPNMLVCPCFNFQGN